MKHNCFNCVDARQEVRVEYCKGKPYRIVEFTCTNPACDIDHVNYPGKECDYFIPIDNGINGLIDRDVLTITEKDYFRKSAQVLANMVLDSDHSYDYKRGFIDAFGQMTIALTSKDDEKE